MTVKDVAKLSGVTVRTLHHYDDIGLLTPSNVTTAGYRLYDESDLESLQQILFFKELGFSLKEISNIILSPSFEKKEALIKQRELLLLKRKRLNKLVRLIDKILKGENTMSFEEFDSSEIKDHINKYEKEVKGKWGDTKAYKQSASKTSKYSDADWQRIKTEAEAVYATFIELMNKNSSKEERDDAVNRWQQHMTDNYYDCSDKTMLGLADMYVADPRFKKNIDKRKDGLAEFMSNCIKNCYS